MFWWFEREGRYLRCEARQIATGQYELRVITPDGSEHIEHFAESDDLSKRQHDVLEAVTRAGWSGPHGWVL